MAERVMAAARLWSLGLTRQTDRAVHEMVDASHGAYERGVLGWTVLTVLHERIGLAWDRGWQPIDLDRCVARTLKEPARALLGDAMAHHLGRVAPGPPLEAAVLEVADQFLLLRLHADHRTPALGVPGHLVVEVGDCASWSGS